MYHTTKWWMCLANKMIDATVPHKICEIHFYYNCFIFYFLFYPIMVFVLNGYQQTNANLCVTNGWMPIDNAAAVAETHMIRWMLAKLDADIFSSPRFRNSIGYAFLSKNNAWLLQNWITINSVLILSKISSQWTMSFWFCLMMIILVAFTMVANGM